MAATLSLQTRGELGRWGFYFHVFRAPEAVVWQLQETRRLYPSSPAFVVSDGGLDFGGACASIGMCRFEWRPPANDRVNPKPFFGRFTDAVRWLRTEYVVMLEPDVQLLRPILGEPLADAGGARDEWNPRVSKPLRDYIEAQGRRSDPKFELRWPRWGLCGGAYVRSAAALDAFDADLIDWRHVYTLANNTKHNGRTYEGSYVFASDVAMWIALGLRGFSVEPWAEMGTDKDARWHGKNMVPRDQIAFLHLGSAKPRYNAALETKNRALVRESDAKHEPVRCDACVWQLDRERTSIAAPRAAVPMPRRLRAASLQFAVPNEEFVPGVFTKVLRRKRARHELCFFWPTYPPHFRHSSIRLSLQAALSAGNASAPAQYVMFDTVQLVQLFCKQHVAACAVPGAHGFALESLIGEGDYQLLRQKCDTNQYSRHGGCAMAGWQLWQTAKKLLGTLSLKDSCERVWLSDSESLPFRSFHVADLVRPHGAAVLWPIASWSPSEKRASSAALGCSGSIARSLKQPDCVRSLLNRFLLDEAGPQPRGANRQEWLESGDFWIVSPAFVESVIALTLRRSGVGFVPFIVRGSPLPTVQLLSAALRYLTQDLGSSRRVQPMNIVEEAAAAFPTAFEQCCSCRASATVITANTLDPAGVQRVEGTAPCWLPHHLFSPCMLRSDSASRIGAFLFHRLGVFSLNPGTYGLTAKIFNLLAESEPNIAFIHNNVYTPDMLNILTGSRNVAPQVKQLLRKHADLFQRGGTRKLVTLAYLNDTGRK